MTNRLLQIFVDSVAKRFVNGPSVPGRMPTAFGRSITVPQAGASFLFYSVYGASRRTSVRRLNPWQHGRAANTQNLLTVKKGGGGSAFLTMMIMRMIIIEDVSLF